MTPRPHGVGGVEGQRRWTLVTTADYPGGIVADGPQIQPGEQPLVVEAPVSPPPEQEQGDGPDRWSRLTDRAVSAEARVAVLEAALEMIRMGTAPGASTEGVAQDNPVLSRDVIHDLARRALRGSVPAGGETDV